MKRREFIAQSATATLAIASGAALLPEEKHLTVEDVRKMQAWAEANSIRHPAMVARWEGFTWIEMQKAKIGQKAISRTSVMPPRGRWGQ